MARKLDKTRLRQDEYLAKQVERGSKNVRQSSEEFQSAPNSKSEAVQPEASSVPPNAFGQEVGTRSDGTRKSPDVEAGGDAFEGDPPEETKD